jgi:hypothetical protein
MGSTARITCSGVESWRIALHTGRAILGIVECPEIPELCRVDNTIGSGDCLCAKETILVRGSKGGAVTVIWGGTFDPSL